MTRADHAETLDHAHRLANRLIHGTALPDDLDDECATTIRTLAYIVEAQSHRLADIRTQADSKMVIPSPIPCTHDVEPAVQCAQCGDWSITDPCVFCRHGVTEASKE